MVVIRESRLVLPFRFLRCPGEPLDPIALGPAHVVGAPDRLVEVRVSAPHTSDPALDDYLETAPAAAAALTVDRIALALAWRVDKLPDFAGPDDLALGLEAEGQRITRQILERFLFYLKFRTRTLWLGQAGSPVGGEVVWRLEGGPVQTTRPASAPLAPGSGLTPSIWGRIRRDLELNFEPEAYEVALMQARELLAIGMRAIAVLTAAIACETKAKRVAEELQARMPGGLADPRYQKLTNRHAKVPTIQVFSTLMDTVCGRNLMREDRALFEAIETLFNVRNAVAHAGRCAVREGAVEREMDLAGVSGLLFAVDRVYAWLDGIYDAAIAA